MAKRIEKQFHIDEIESIATIVVDLVSKSKQSDRATIVELSGDLGAGKTTLVKSIAKQLGIEKTIQSPTFVILKNYQLQNQNFENMIHIDAYRLNKGEELQKLQWDEYVKNPESVIFIEWPEQVVGLLPKDTIRVTLAHRSEHERTITIIQ